ncbi:hypothetical protein SAMN05216564_1152 [Halopenitus persicus]|uniref:Uncharacterized protein n=1 Tax=Halopenitus persicus TaxID=1048396 RepID=A0A1H3NSB9_9EURY|nr:hypothetical protein SAMN05216564_1152 [Halopenitus persicus]
MSAGNLLTELFIRSNTAFIKHVCCDESRAHSVDANVIIGVFPRCCLRQSEDTMFCGHVRRGILKPDVTKDGRHIDDYATVVLAGHLINFCTE